MYVITVAGPKGGCGKSTLTSALAVRATQDSGKVAMIDLNEDQGTLGDWWVQRGRPVNPFLEDSEGMLDQLVAGLEADGWSHCLIDGPPYAQDLIEMSVIVATCIIIPVKLTYFDTSAIDSIVSMCKRHAKPYLFVVNEYDERAQWTNSNNIGLLALEGRGPIAKQKISSSPKHRVGQMDGKTGAEMDTRGKQKGAIAKEIDALWAEVTQLVRRAKPALKVVEGARGRS